MASVEDQETDAAGLAATVLEEEARREDEQVGVEETTVLPDDLLPGVGNEAMGFRRVIAKGGVSTVAVLSLLNLADEFDRAAVQVLAPDIQRTLGVSDTLLGVLGTVSGLLLVVAVIPLGYLADRIRRSPMVGIASLIFAVFSFATGLIQNAWQFAATRVMTGIGKADSLPVHNSWLADAYPIEGRNRVFAIHGMAAPVGQMLGPILAGAIAFMVGGAESWRWAFLVLAVPTLVLGVIAFFLPNPVRGGNEQREVTGEASEQDDEPAIPLAAAFARLKKIQTFYYLLLGVGVLGFALFSVPLFFTLFLEREFGLDALNRGMVISIAQGGALVTGPLAGIFGDRLFRRSPPLALQLMAGALLTYGLALVTSLYMPNLVTLTIVATLAMGMQAAGFIIASAVISSVLPYRLRSQGYAMFGLYLLVIGAFFGALLTGSLSDAYGPRVALTLVVPGAAVVGSALIAYGSRFVRDDISLVVSEMLEEQEERRRVSEQGGDVPVLQVRNLDFSYGQVQVLFDVAVDVYEGEVLALLGTNGAGKSTLLKAVSGLALPDRGVIRLDGRTITYLDAETLVDYGIVQVPGGKAVFPTLSVRENLIAGSYQFIWDRATVEERVGEVLELFPRLQERLDQPAGTLSGGEQQMLALAKGLLLRPRLLLLDELSLGLAPVVVTEILEVVDDLKARGITMIIVEQSVNVALTMADRAVFMEKGQVRFQGPADELRERDDLVRAVFLGGEGG